MSFNLIVISLIVGIIFIILFQFFSKAKVPTGARLAPSIPKLPLVGNAHQLFFNRHRILSWLDSEIAKYGQCISGTVLKWGDFLLAAEPECAEHILKTNFDNYPKGPYVYQVLTDVLGNGIFAADGESWKSQRKTWSHLFKTSLLKSFMYETFLEHADLVLKILNSYADSKEEFNTIDLFYRYTLDSIGQIAFGKDIGSLKQPGPISRAFDLALNRTELRMANPILMFIYDSKLTGALKILDEFAYSLIKERRNDPNVAQKGDLLSQYISQTKESDRYLRDVIMNFLIAGRDTTGQTLQWLFYLLSQNPQVEAKLIQEIDQQIKEEKPTYEQIKDLPYLDGVVQETLRLYPPVPIDPKYALNDDVLPNGVFVAKGTNVIWSAWAMGRCEKYWEKPLEMRPERWLPENKKAMHPYLHIPFQAGPRICLGMTMALMEVKLLTILILQKFQLRLVPNHPVVPKFNITLSSEFGMKMIVQHRSN